MNARPQRGVGRILADPDVVADELDGQGVVVHQQFGRNRELGFGVAAVRAAKLPRRGLDGGEERSVHDELEMAQLRNETGRKGVVDVNLGGAHHMGLRQREVDIVLPVDAVQLNLRRTGVGEGEGVAILAGRNGRILVAGGRFASAAGISPAAAPVRLWERRPRGPRPERKFPPSARWKAKWICGPAFPCRPKCCGRSLSGRAWRSGRCGPGCAAHCRSRGPRPSQARSRRGNKARW